MNTMEPIRTLDDDALLTHLAEQARLLAQAFSRADPAAPVPGLQWDARTVLSHTGAVHRWAADIVARRLATNETGGSIAFWPACSQRIEELAAWFGDGAAALISTLREATREFVLLHLHPPMLLPARSGSVGRHTRQPSTGPISRLRAAGPVTAVDSSFAQDGLGEIVGAFATEPGFATDRIRDGFCSKLRTARHGRLRSAAARTLVLCGESGRHGRGRRHPGHQR